MITLEKAKKLLGKTGKSMSDKQIIKTIDDLTVLVNILLDKWEKMPLEEKKRWKTKKYK